MPKFKEVFTPGFVVTMLLTCSIGGAVVGGTLYYRVHTIVDPLTQQVNELAAQVKDIAEGLKRQSQ